MRFISTKVQRKVLRVVLSFLVGTASLSCGHAVSPIFGTYKIYSEDPAVQQWIVGENTYLKLNSDKTIIYNSTMNGKQRFHFEGNFILDNATNTLTVQWKEGKLPGKIQVQKVGVDYIIQIGTTTYKKEKTDS